jgi:hypothetical protein
MPTMNMETLEMNDLDMEVAAQEMALHVSMCVNGEYIRSWGLDSFLTKLLEYVDDSDVNDVQDALFYLENK